MIVTNDLPWFLDCKSRKARLSQEFMDQKIDYIHQNPVKAGIVYEPEHYVYSSAIDYAGGKGLIEIVFP